MNIIHKSIYIINYETQQVIEPHQIMRTALKAPM